MPDILRRGNSGEYFPGIPWDLEDSFRKAMANAPAD